MAEYVRRRQLFVAERKDTSARAATIGGIVAFAVGIGIAVLATVAGATLFTTIRLAFLGIIAIGVAALVRFYRSPIEIETWREDAEAERRTARALDRLVRAGYTVLHDRKLSDTAANVDHLVIGSSGAWIIETDAHRGPLWQNKAGLWAAKVPLRPMLGLVSWMGEEVTSQLVADLPEGWQLEVQPVVAFDRAELPHGLLLIEGVVLLPASGVADYILSAGVVLKPLDVAMLVDVAERAFPPYPVSEPPPTWPALSRLRGILRR
ncbi:MAG: nuclease-related domain-containing protein [Frankia sp.]